jgi:hypothetical protein
VGKNAIFCENPPGGKLGLGVLLLGRWARLGCGQRGKMRGKERWAEPRERERVSPPFSLFWFLFLFKFNFQICLKFV